MIIFFGQISVYKDLLIGGTALNKDVKTSLNFGTKFQDMKEELLDNSRNRFYDPQLLHRNSNSTVRSLTSKFDIKNSYETANSKEKLKRIVKDQNNLISSLNSQLEAKEKRIKELEYTLKVVINNKPKN